MDSLPFVGFNKIPRLSRECIITEKIDGTNAQIYIDEQGNFFTGCRTRWITPEKDNFGFSKWAHENKEELMKLGPGHHFGEWWGKGIQRNYGLEEKRFSLFNVSRWGNANIRPICCNVVPIIRTGLFNDDTINDALEILKQDGSKAVPGYPDPEGIVIYHVAGNFMFKKTILNDEKPKEQNEKEI